LDPTDHFQQPAHQLVNLGIRLEGTQWTVSGHVSNVFNKLYNTEYIQRRGVQAPFNVAGSAGAPLDRQFELPMVTPMHARIFLMPSVRFAAAAALAATPAQPNPRLFDHRARSGLGRCMGLRSRR